MQVEDVVAQFLRSNMSRPTELKRPASPVKLQPRKDVHNGIGDMTRSGRGAAAFHATIPTSIVSNVEEVVETLLKKSGKKGSSISCSKTVEIVERIDMTQHDVPSKSQIKRAAMPKMHRADRVFSKKKGVGPGSSRSTMLDAIKAIAADGDGPDRGTGCIVRNSKDELPEAMKPTTTRGIGNVIGGYQIIK